MIGYDKIGYPRYSIPSHGSHAAQASVNILQCELLGRTFPTAAHVATLDGCGSGVVQARENGAPWVHRA